MSKRIRDQRQQIAEQIENKGRNFGNVMVGKPRQFVLGNENLTTEPPADLNIKWRKRFFFSQQIGLYYTPDEGDFINWALTGNLFIQSSITSRTGFLVDTSIPQYTVASYDIEVWRKTPITVDVPLDTDRSIRVEVDDIVIHDSGDEGPNNKRSIRINIGGQKWTKIQIYFYTGSSRSDDNRFSFEIPLVDIVEKTRISIPDAPDSISASQGTFANMIKVNWTANNPSEYEYYQIFYGSGEDAQNNILASQISADIFPLEYSHTSLSGGDLFYYKIRAITDDGEVTSFVGPASGWTSLTDANTFNTIRELVYELNATGLQQYYTSANLLSAANGVSIGVKTEVPVGTPSLFEILCSDYSGTLCTGTYVATQENVAYYKIIGTGWDGSNRGLKEGKVTVYVDYNGVDFTMPVHTGWFIVDNTNPVGSLIISPDAFYRLNENDRFTRNRQIYIIPTGTLDPTTNAIADPSTGRKHVSDIAFIRFGEGTNATIALSSGEWIPYSPGTVYTWELTEATGLKTIWGQVSDRAGNMSAFGAMGDQIYLSTGYIQNVRTSLSPVVTGDDYTYIEIQWPTIARDDIWGYQVWRTTTSGTAPITTGANAQSPIFETNNDIVTSTFRDDWAGTSQTNSRYISPIIGPGTVQQDTPYYYWVKAVTWAGDVSSGFDIPISGWLRTTAPNDYLQPSTATGWDGERFWLDWRANTGNDEQIAVYHRMFRVNISDNPASLNYHIAEDIIDDDSTFKFIDGRDQNFGTGSAASRLFRMYDLPPVATSFYQYFMIGINKYGYHTTGTSANPLGTGLRINNGPPSKPVISTSNSLGRYWGVHLEMNTPAETDITKYYVYIESGSLVGTEPTVAHKFVFDYNSQVNATAPSVNILRDNLPWPSGSNTFWVKAEDDTGLQSDISEELVTGTQMSAPPVPVWVTDPAESYTWYGFNHITFSGLRYAEGLLKGYKIYRHSTNVYTTTGVQLLTTVFDQRSNGAKNSYEDHDVEPWNPYYYWVSSINTYDHESDVSSVLDLNDVVEPNYTTLFVNRLDNSSFERNIVGGTITEPDLNWTNVTVVQPETEGEEASPFGRYAAKLRGGSSLNNFTYSGYIITYPGDNYYLSFYALKGASGDNGVTVSVVWYNTDREAEIATSSITFTSTKMTSYVNEWHRYTLGDSSQLMPFLTAPTSGTNAKIVFTRTGAGTTQSIYVDAVQFEPFVTGVSPSAYVDSRVVTADLIAAHTVRGDQLEFNSIKGNKLEADTISGREIRAGSITADLFASMPTVPAMEFGMDLLTSGVHTIYLSGGNLAIAGSRYVIADVAADDVGHTALGRLFTATDNLNTYYGYYNNETDSGTIHFTSNLTNALNNGTFIVGAWRNSTVTINDGESYENAGFFTYNGPWAGPGITLRGNDITAGTISGNLIKAGTMYANRIRAGIFGNQIPNALFHAIDEDALYDNGYTDQGGYYSTLAVQDWKLYNGNTQLDPSSDTSLDFISVGLGDESNGNALYHVSHAPYKSYYCLKLRNNSTTTNRKHALGPYIPVVSGESFRLSTYYLFATDSPSETYSFILGLVIYDKSFQEITTVNTVNGWSNVKQIGSSRRAHYKNVVSTTSTNRNAGWVQTGFDVSITYSGAMFVQPVIAEMDYAGVTTLANRPYMYLSGIQYTIGTSDSPANEVTPRVDGTAIVAESIYSNSIAANAITATHIQAGTINALHLGASSVTADSIAAGAVTASKLRIRSIQMQMNPNMDRWASDALYGTDPTSYGNNEALEGWLFRSTAGTSVWHYRKDNSIKKYGMSSVLVSGTNSNGSNTYMDSRKNPVTDRFPLILEAGKSYAAGMWIYKHAASDDFNITLAVDVYTNQTFDNRVKSISRNFTSADNDTWVLMSDIFTPTAITWPVGTGTNGRLAIDFTDDTFSPFAKFNIGQAGILEGNEFPTGYLGEGTSFFDGAAIQTGTIDAERVSIVSSGSQVTIDGNGITVGNDEFLSTLTSTDLEFYNNGIVTKYVKRVDVYRDESLNSAITFSPGPFLQAPIVIIAPVNIQTYSSSLGSSVNQHLSFSTESLTSSSVIAKAYLGRDPIIVKIQSGGLHNYDTSELKYGYHSARIGETIDTTGFTSQWISYRNTNNASPFITGDKVSLRINSVISDLNGDRVALQADVVIRHQFILGQVISGPDLTVTHLANYDDTYTYNSAFYGSDSLYSHTFGNLTDSIDYGFQIRVYEVERTGAKNVKLASGFAIADSAYVGIYTDYVATALTSGTVDIIAIEQG